MWRRAFGAESLLCPGCHSSFYWKALSVLRDVDRPAECAGPWLRRMLVLAGARPSCSGHSPWCCTEPGPSFSYCPLLARVTQDVHQDMVTL